MLGKPPLFAMVGMQREVRRFNTDRETGHQVLSVENRSNMEHDGAKRSFLIAFDLLHKSLDTIHDPVTHRGGTERAAEVACPYAIGE